MEKSWLSRVFFVGTLGMTMLLGAARLTFAACSYDPTACPIRMALVVPIRPMA